MKLKLTLSLVVLLMYASLSNAQDCGSNNGQPTPNCNDAPFICLDGYTSTLDEVTGVGPNPLCSNGGGPHNIQWVAFEAQSTDLEITIIPSNCLNGGGMQAGVYTDCSFTTEMACQGVCQTGTFSISGNAFEVGVVYYFFVDGCAGDICDYVIDITQGMVGGDFPPPGDVQPIVGPETVCEGQSDVLYSVPCIDNAQTYEWTIPPGATFVSANTSGNEILVNFELLGGQICVTGMSTCPPAPSEQVCIDVIMEPAPVGTLEDYICEGYPYFYEGEEYLSGYYEVRLDGQSYASCDSVVLLTLTDYVVEDFDLYVNYCQGEFYNYETDGGDYTEGVYNITLFASSYLNCDSTVILHVAEQVATEGIFEIAICQGESYEVCQDPFEEEGSYVYDCNPNFYGCDSLIILDLIVLNPIADIFFTGTLGCDLNTPFFLDGLNSEGDSYFWTTTGGDICDSETSPFIQICAPGEYCLEVTSSVVTADQGLVECTDQICVIVEADSSLPIASNSSTNVACNGEENGSINITVTNDSIGPFTYDWTPNVSSSETANDLPAGTYTVVITAESNGCDVTEIIEILEPSLIDITLSQTDIPCSNDETGTATAMPSGGTGPYSYLWCNAQTTDVATDLPAGPCIVVVTDANDCTQSITATILEASELTVTLDETNVICNGGSTGSVTANPGGGTGPYTYLWCDGQITQTAINLSEGTCSVVVTDASDCSITEISTLTEPSIIDLEISQTNVLCNGDTNGTGTVTPSGGVGPYTYLWCNNETTQVATGLGVGPCAVIVTDANGCTQTSSVAIESPTTIILTTTQTEVLCDGASNGTATVTPDGGEAPFTYLWCNNQTSATATDLPAGPCEVIVTDANNCTQMASVDVAAPTAVTVSTTQTNILCNGDNDGTATATPEGGTGPYTYQWCNGQTEETATDLPFGNCQIIITDDNGCIATAIVDIEETTSISVEIASTNVLCNGENNGTATATPSGGAGGFSYEWCNGETTATVDNLPAGACIVIVTDANGCSESESVTLTEPTTVNVSANATDISCNGANDGTATASGSGGSGTITYLWCNNQTSSTATDLPAGPCEVIVTDANGCTNSAIVNPTEPDAIVLGITSEDVTCFGESNGTATVTPSGGTGPGTYSYLWCNNQATQTAIDLDVGPCEVIVTDGNGCTQTTSIDLSQPNSTLEVSGTSQNATCGTDDGSISLVVTGGTTPYSYDWNDPATDVQNPNDLGPGNYTVVVTDGNDCTTSFSIGVMTPTGLDVDPDWTNVSCNEGEDGTVSVLVVGGTPPYEYDWDSPLITPDSPTGMNLPAGGYNVTVTDADGCTFVTSAAIEEPEMIEISGNATEETCGESNGTISTVVQGGTSPYTYDWSSNDNTPNIDDLPAGNYILDLTDANGCTATFEISVSTPNALAVTNSQENVSCFEGNDGSIDLEVTGGIGPFVYDWDNAGPVENPDNLEAGIYNVIITDATGCSIVDQVTITEPTEIVVVELVQLAICDEDNGGVSLMVSGGSAPYTYQWSNNTSLDNVSDLPVGTIIVTVTDNNGCEAIKAIDVDAIPPMSLNVSGTMTSCFEGVDGEIDLSVIGGTGPYNYLWTNNSIDEDPTNLEPGVYSVVVTDANQCTEETSITIGEPTAIEISGSTTNATCGNTNGSASIAATGGTSPYTYSWTGTTSTDPNPIDLGPGNYCVIVTDANGCTNTECFDVETPDGLALTPSVTNVNCFGDSTGTVSIEVVGGIGPFTYLWQTGEETAELSNVPAGTYNVVVTDTNTGCEIVTSALVEEPTMIDISGSELQATCGDANGSVSLTVSGGTGPYTYLWTPSMSIEQNPTGLEAIEHTVEVSDSYGCTQTYSITVTSASELISSAVGTDVSCFGGADGVVDITVEGGTPPYSYAWSNASILEDPNDFSAGIITGTVTDFYGCTSEVSLVLSEPEAIAVSSESTDETCGESNGTISLTVTGGTGPFSYAWTPALPDTPNPTDLTIGDYCVDIIDANGCILNYCTSVSTPNALTLNTVISDAACNGTEDGFIDLTITGGVGPFTQVWTPGGWTGEDLLDIPAGTYTVVVTDATLCSSTTTEIIGEPTIIEISDVSTPAICGESNGTTDITATGGNGVYTYLWSNDSEEEDPNDFASGNYIVTVTDGNGCTGTHEISVVPLNGPMILVTPTDASCNEGTDGAADLSIVGGMLPFTFVWSVGGAVTEDVANLPAGNYSVTVTDGDGCTYTASTLIEEPDAIIVVGNPTEETCNLSNGTITTSVSGGTGDYTYAWTPSGSTLANPTGLAAMDHTVVVTDANGCTGSLVVTVDAPNALTGSVSSTNVSCDSGLDGQISATILGGNGPYSYLWSPIGGTESVATNLPAGTYTLLVTDADACEFTLTEILTAPAAVTLSGTSTDALCGDENGSVTVVADGGVGGYNYEWIPALSNTPNPTDLAAGSYTCIVTDANGCTAETTVAVNTPGMLTVTASPFDATCSGGEDGFATATPSGGSMPYTYLWMPGGSIEQNPAGLAAGTYTVALTDATNCVVTASIVIGEPTAISISDTTTPALCNMNNGSADLTVTGGTAPYTYLWNTTSTEEDPIDFGPGNYTVVVTDANDCTASHEIMIDSPGQPTVTVEPYSATCNGDSDGGINLTVSGGTGPFVYAWNTGGVTTEDLADVPAATYSVSVTDANGCTYEYSGLVTEPDVLFADAPGPTSILCNGNNNGSADLTVTGGTAPYVYLWTPSGNTTPNPTNLVVGDNTFVVTDANGCTVTDVITLTEPDALVLSAQSEATLCGNGSDGSIDLTVVGGTLPFTFAWSNASTDEDPVGLSAGVYIVLVTDDNGCTATLNETVEEPTEVAVVVTNISEYGIYNLSCETSEDGSAEAGASGGSGPYTFVWDNGTLGAELSSVSAGTYTVVATDINGCTGTSQLSLEAPTGAVVSFYTEAISCFGESDGAIFVEEITGGTPPYQYSINDSDFSGTGLFGSLSVGSYDIVIQDANGCTNTESVQLDEPAELVVNLGDDIEIQLGEEPFNIEAIVNVGIDSASLQYWEWTQGRFFTTDSTRFDGERAINPLETTLYEFYAIDTFGCVGIDQMLVSVRKDRKVYIPNAFSPNGDGNNDIFYIQSGIELERVKTFKIFNRWGEIVYELSDFYANDPNNGWDGMFKGEELNQAVFVFWVELEFKDGWTEIVKGDVTLLK